jgi:hypothetical protein
MMGGPTDDEEGGSMRRRQALPSWKARRAGVSPGVIPHAIQD